tara:strand:- start:16359 stop:19112 length:2754 start_codon:yes stop_codon:yes gene_type:complete
MPEKPLILIDGSSYLFRAYHALPSLTTSNDKPTGAIKGVISMIKRLQKDNPESVLVVIFDASGKTFREEMFPSYKANRPSMPEDLRQQIEPIHSIIKAMGLPLISLEGVEADDVIGTYAREASDCCRSVLVSTSDKDISQLVNKYVSLVNTMTGQFLNSQGVEEKFGVPPQNITDYLGLLGDKSDNIPGVAGIGEKSAIFLIKELGDLDAIYSRIDEIPTLSLRGAKNIAKNLQDSKEIAYLSRELATIKTDVILPVALADLENTFPDESRLLELFKEAEFRSWVDELESRQSRNIRNLEIPDKRLMNRENEIPDKPEYQLVVNKEDLIKWIKRIRERGLVCVDTETTSLDYMSARLVGISIAVDPQNAAYIPFGHDYLGAPAQLSEKYVLSELKPILEDKCIKKVGQNIKYDLSVLSQHGIDMQGVFFDTMLQSYVLDATATRHDMDTLAAKHLNYSTIKFEDIAGTGSSQLTFNQIPLEKAAPYAAEDADISLRLFNALDCRVRSEDSLLKLYNDIEMPLIAVLSRMECRGALIDGTLLLNYSQELSERLDQLERHAWDVAGQHFNLASPKQIGHILYECMGLPILKKTARGSPSTREDVLQELALSYPLPKILLEYRGIAKLKSTYTDKLPSMINTRTGRIHTSYHQAGTATGRLSSSNPNLQNIPIKTPQGRRVREAFIAAPGYKIIAADYSQIELRIMAHLSRDPNLIAAFAKGEDVHRRTAAEIFSAPPSQITESQRRSAKAINFGLIYGMSAFGLSKQLNIARKDAQGYIDRYFKRYPGVLRYMNETRTSAADCGYVETLFGRRLYLSEINSPNSIRRQAAERIAINAPMQGTAADIIKRAMLTMDAWIQQGDSLSFMTMQVHDELVLEAPTSEVEIVVEVLKEKMQSAAELLVPLVVDVGVGLNWNEAH